jgi:hypothetical protein
MAILGFFALGQEDLLVNNNLVSVESLIMGAL